MSYRYELSGKLILYADNADDAFKKFGEYFMSLYEYCISGFEDENFYTTAEPGTDLVIKDNSKNIFVDSLKDAREV